MRGCNDGRVPLFWVALLILPADTPMNGLPSAAITVTVISLPIAWSKVTTFLRTIRAIDPEDAARGEYRAHIPLALLPRLARV